VVDCTVGLGGHAGALLRARGDLRVIGLDVDEGNLAVARGRLGTPWPDTQPGAAVPHTGPWLAPCGSDSGPLAGARGSDLGRVTLVRANFADLGQVLAELGVGKVGGILADLGVSSNQIGDAARGLSFDVDGPLDMRLDATLSTTAADLVNGLGEGELADLLYLQSQERHSRRIAKRICQARRQGRLNSTVALARLVAAAVGQDPDSRRSRIHPATRTFMALRMSVNHETRSLEKLLAQAPQWLATGGRVAIISFHSVEDRLVKEDFRERSRAGAYRLLTKKPLTASPEEAASNPRSRSAKLRAAELV
jgi:16S rRNA (cytosine1402-N4)-methyltransferase